MSTSAWPSSQEQAIDSHPVDVLSVRCSPAEEERLRGRESGGIDIISSRPTEETVKTNHLANEELNGFPDVNIVLGRRVEPAGELVLAAKSIHLSGIQFGRSSGIALWFEQMKSKR